MMTCEESQRAFSPYLDGVLPRGACDALDEHVGVCPICRHRFSETRGVVRALSLVSRPAPPPGLAASLRGALPIERAARGANPPPPLHRRWSPWGSPRVMPYAVGARSPGTPSPAAFLGPPPNRRAIDDLQEALRQNPAFVPASLDRRPQTMRVVFVLQKMNVPESSY